ncbi:hypothetical protein MAR_017189 [Mya arenaria]|uniref:DUF6570 domain-containing protein n=1 Tax=Mya arenaria TaxID=6604 RepID=A0ABY7EEP9_MYAAR|nr:hypothetical protein MAR_017189 [Mya arenaria]
MEKNAVDRLRDKGRKKCARTIRTDEQTEVDRLRDKGRKACTRTQHTGEQTELDRLRDKEHNALASKHNLTGSEIKVERHVPEHSALASKQKRTGSEIKVESLKLEALQSMCVPYVIDLCLETDFKNSNYNLTFPETLTQIKFLQMENSISVAPATDTSTRTKFHHRPKLSIPDTPGVLSELTEFKTRLLAMRYPFMKIVQLPRGKQKGIIGRVINISVQADDVCSSLPGTLSTSGILPVKLKRKTSYKGHVIYQNIRPDKVRQALQWLLLNNRHYQNVVESLNWESTSEQDNPVIWQSFVDKEEDNCPDNTDANNESHKDPFESEHSDSQFSDSESSDDGMPLPTQALEETQFDTCIQPNDPASDASNILTIAPGEGNHPLHFMMDTGCEEQYFPSLFRTGCYGFDVRRDIKITPKKYFNAHYLFFAQHITKHKQAMDSVSIALRKSYKALPSQQTIDASFIKDPEKKIQSLILKDKVYHFLQTVRRSPPYWQKCMYKLMAAVKQFGIFTFFVTLSSADLKWPDTLNAILRQ